MSCPVSAFSRHAALTDFVPVLISVVVLCVFFFKQVLCLEKEKTNLSEQLKQLKPRTMSPRSEDAAASPMSTTSDMSASKVPATHVDDVNLAVTPALVRDGTDNLSVGEVTKNEEVGAVEMSNEESQPTAEPSSNKSSPASVRSSSSGGPPIMPYSMHKRMSSSFDSTPETTPETPRKEDASAKARQSDPIPEPAVDKTVEESSSVKPVTAAISSGDSPAQEKKADSKPHAFMKSNAPSGVAALAAVMSGVGHKVGPPKETGTTQANATPSGAATPSKTGPNNAGMKK